MRLHMSATDDVQRHWRDIATQLGLPAEPPPVEAATPEATTEPEPLPVEQKEPRRAVEETEDIAERQEPPDREERRPSRGRRRGRRGRRAVEPGTPDSNEEESVSEPAPDAGDLAEEQHREPSRRRGPARSRTKKPEREEAESLEGAVDEDEHQAASEEAPSIAGDDDDEDDEDDMSDWAIPSWQELIDSLYRPDR